MHWDAVAAGVWRLLDVETPCNHPAAQASLKPAHPRARPTQRHAIYINRVYKNELFVLVSNVFDTDYGTIFGSPFNVSSLGCKWSWCACGWFSR
jgi:hypothetical protein